MNFSQTVLEHFRSLLKCACSQFLRIVRFWFVRVSSWCAGRYSMRSFISLFILFISIVARKIRFNEKSKKYKIQNSAGSSMELRSTNFTHYLLGWILTRRIHVMDFQTFAVPSSFGQYDWCRQGVRRQEFKLFIFALVLSTNCNSSSFSILILTV